MKNIDWWWDTAQHMWRTFFALEHEPDDNMSSSAQYVCNICNTIIRTQFSDQDRIIMQEYYARRDCLDRYFVEDYSLKHNINPTVIWMIVRRANRAVIEALGIIEPKKGVNNP